MNLSVSILDVPMKSQMSERIERAKMEVLVDVAAGIVPVTNASFCQLHDYMDANGYGGTPPTVQ